MKCKRSAKELETLLKGGANHWRIRILQLVAENAGQLGVDDISEALSANNKTISVHSQVLLHAGLLHKTYRGRKVVHALTRDGKQLLSFLASF